MQCCSNEFLKEHRKVEEREATIAKLEKEFDSKLSQQQKDFTFKIAQQQKQIETLTTGLQKVSARIALEKPARRLTAKD